MAFTIKKIEGANTNLIELQLCKALAQSRFVASITNTGTALKFSKIRLKQSKDYCGNHPYACPVRPGGPKPHIHSKCLEGADWVAFNDMLNDVLDALNVSANVASSLCIVRKGALRRVEYHGHKLGNGIDSEWNRDADAENYQDWRGRIAARSTFPQDTPGIDQWREGVEDSRGELLHAH